MPFTSGAYQTRTLNTVEADTEIVSLSANQFTLGPGKYEIDASSPAFRVDTHKSKLRNITDSLDTIIGSTEESGNGAGVNTSTRSIIKGNLL